MKSFLLAALIAFSLGLNALIIVALASPETVAPLLGAIRPDKTASRQSTGSPGWPRPNSGSATADDGRSSASWADLKSDDPATLVANLRAAGFSDPEIRAMLSFQLNQKVIDRRKELSGPTPDLPYWRVNTGLSSTSALYANPQNLAELRAMNKQNNQLLDSLVGPAPEALQTNLSEKLQYADLPADKIAQLKLINSDYADLNSSITIGTNGIYFPEDRAKLKLIADEKDKDIRALLTPEEYDNFQLRSSSTANSMRNNLTLFQPTEEEFRKIFAIQSAFDQQYNMSGGIDIALLNQRAQAQNDLTAQIKASLSPDRVAEYEKSTNSSYKQAVALTTRLDLPKENASQLWSLQQDTQQKITALRTDQTLTPDSRMQALSALQQTVTSQATGLLGGQRGLDAYKQNGGGWMQNIVPPTPTTAPGALVRPF